MNDLPSNTLLYDVALRRLMSEKLDDSSIAVVWFDVFGQPMDDAIQRLRRPLRVMELISQCRREGKMPRLLDVIRENNTYLSDDLLELESQTDEKVRDAATSPASPLPANDEGINGNANRLPLFQSTFIGRASEIISVKHLVENHNLVTLTGIGGIGKTRLATEIGRSVADTFADGLFYLSLSPLQESQRVPELLVSMLGGDSKNGVTFADIVQMCKNRKMLVILDACERFVKISAEIVRAILASEDCKKVRFLLTSQIPLEVDGEQVYSVPGLAVPPENTLYSEAKSYDAVALFENRRQLQSHRFAVTASNVKQVVAICRILDGVPLAIAVAAAQMGSETVAGLLSSLESFQSANDESMTAFKMSFAWSLTQLNQQESNLLMLLTWFKGGCTQEYLEKIARTLPNLPASVYPAVGHLRMMSLVYSLTSHERERLHLLTIVRQFLLGQSWDAERYAIFKNAYCDFFVDLARSENSLLYGDAHQTVLDNYRDEQANYEYALSLCERDASLNRKGLVLAGDLWRFWQLLGQVALGRSQIDKMMAACRKSHGEECTLEWGLAYVGAGALAREQGDFDYAEDYFTKSLEIWKQLGFNRLEGNASANLGLIAAETGRLDEARKLLNESLVIRERLRDRAGMANNYLVMGGVEIRAGNYTEAKAHYEACRRIRLKMKDVNGIAECDNNIADIYWKQGDSKSAEPKYFAALKSFRQSGNLSNVARCLINLANISFDSATDTATPREDSDRLLQKAEKDYLEALEIATGLENRRIMADSLVQLTDIAIRRNNPLYAEELLHRATDLAQYLDDSSILASISDLNKIITAQP